MGNLNAGGLLDPCGEFLGEFRFGDPAGLEVNDELIPGPE